MSMYHEGSRELQDRVLVNPRVGLAGARPGGAGRAAGLRRYKGRDHVCPTRSCPKLVCGSSSTSVKPARS